MAAVAAGALGIALTARGEHDGKPIAMCGVPIHAAEGYLARLIRRGFRVAVAEQMEAASARTGKAPLKREIVRLVTPGTLTEDALLDGTRSQPAAGAGSSTGRARWARPGSTSRPGCSRPRRWQPMASPALLGRLDPAEILVAPLGQALGDHGSRRAPESLAPEPVSPATSRRRLAEAFGRGDVWTRFGGVFRCRGNPLPQRR